MGVCAEDHECIGEWLSHKEAVFMKNMAIPVGVHRKNYQHRVTVYPKDYRHKDPSDPIQILYECWAHNQPLDWGTIKPSWIFDPEELP